MTRLLSMITAGLIFSLPVQANVERSALSWQIKDKEPVSQLQDSVSIPSAGISKLYFFTELTDLKGKQVVHRWRFNGQDMASVVLDVGADSWRTYSSKRLVASWTGPWTIEVVVEGEVIHRHEFTLVSEE